MQFWSWVIFDSRICFWIHCLKSHSDRFATLETSFKFDAIGDIADTLTVLVEYFQDNALDAFILICTIMYPAYGLGPPVSYLST